MDISSHYRSKAERVHRALTYLLIDEDENGRPDIKVITESVSSVQRVIWLYDTDEDGELDVVGYDYNFDSQPDIFRRM